MSDTKAFAECLKKLCLNDQANELVMQAFKKPRTINEKLWKQLIDILVKVGMSDMKHGRLSAKICNYIAQAEAASCDSLDRYFRSLLLKTLQSEYKKHTDLNYEKETLWINFVNFLCAVFDLLRLNNMPLMALVSPVFEILGVLAQSHFAQNETAIQCLVMQLQFVGEELDRLSNDKMNELVTTLRKLFLHERTSQLSRLMLLEIIELRSGGWKLSASAYKYYYEGTSN